MKLKFYATIALLVALYAAYFFIRHSFVIMSLTTVLTPIVLFALVCGVILFVRRK